MRLRWAPPDPHQTFHLSVPFRSVQSGLAWVWSGCGRFLLSLSLSCPRLATATATGAGWLAGRRRELKILECGLVASPHWPLDSCPCLHLPPLVSTVDVRRQAWIGPSTTTTYINPHHFLQACSSIARTAASYPPCCSSELLPRFDSTLPLLQPLLFCFPPQESGRLPPPLSAPPDASLLV